MKLLTSTFLENIFRIEICWQEKLLLAFLSGVQSYDNNLALSHYVSKLKRYIEMTICSFSTFFPTPIVQLKK